MSEFRRRLMMVGKVLPYDAEVEYLQTVGNQWFQLPVYASEVTDAFEITFRRTDNTNQQRYCGENDGNAAFNLYINGSGRVGYYNNGGWRAASSDDLSSIGLFLHTIKLDYYNKKVWLDTNSWSLTGGNSSSSSTAYLDIMNKYSRNNPYIKGLIYGCKFWRSGELLYDLIPVRKNSEGYMYDKVGGQLYGNQGTGSFTIGYDKYTSLSDYTQIDYLSNSSTAFINSMIAASSNTKVELKFRNSQSTPNNWRYIFGEQQNSNSRYGLYSSGTRSQLVYLFGSSETNTGIANDTSAHTVIFEQGSLSIDGVSVGTPSGTFTSYVPLFLFTSTDASSRSYPQSSGQYDFYGDIYYFKIYDNNVLVRDFVPVLHPANVYGMFDKVENKFYASASSTAFTGGNDN